MEAINEYLDTMNRVYSPLFGKCYCTIFLSGVYLIYLAMYDWTFIYERIEVGLTFAKDSSKL